MTRSITSDKKIHWPCGLTNGQSRLMRRVS